MTADPRIVTRGDPRVPRAPQASSDVPALRVEIPARTGPVPPTALARSVADRLPGLRRECCGADDRRCSGLRGRLVLKLELSPGGSVAAPEVAETSVYDDSFRRCLLQAAAGWRLAGHDGAGSTTVSVPILVRFADPAPRED